MKKILTVLLFFLFVCDISAQKADYEDKMPAFPQNLCEMNTTQLETLKEEIRQLSASIENETNQLMEKMFEIQESRTSKNAANSKTVKVANKKLSAEKEQLKGKLKALNDSLNDKNSLLVAEIMQVTQENRCSKCLPKVKTFLDEMKSKLLRAKSDYEHYSELRNIVEGTNHPEYIRCAKRFDFLILISTMYLSRFENYLEMLANSTNE